MDNPLYLILILVIFAWIFTIWTEYPEEPKDHNSDTNV